MFGFINQFFSALSSIFLGLDNIGKAGAILSNVAVQKAEAYSKEEEIKIRARLLKLQADAAKDPQLVIEQD